MFGRGGRGEGGRGGKVIFFARQIDAGGRSKFSWVRHFLLELFTKMAVRSIFGYEYFKNVLDEAYCALLLDNNGIKMGSIGRE